MGRAGRPNASATALRESDLLSRSIPPQAAHEAAESVSHVVDASLKDGALRGSEVSARLSRLAEEGYQSLGETGGFARGQAILTALSPEISGSELAHAATRQADLQNYLHQHGLQFTNSGQAFVSTEVVERALSTETEAEIARASQADDRRQPIGSGYLPARYFLKDGQLLPSEEAYEVSLDGEAASMEISRKQKDGKLHTEARLEISPSSRKWDEKEGTWIEDNKLRNYSETWKIQVEESDEGVRVFLIVDAPASEGKLPELSASHEEIEAAGGIASWTEQQMESLIKKDRQWEEKNPQAAKKRRKAYHDRKEEERAKRTRHRRHNPYIQGRNKTY